MVSIADERVRQIVYGAEKFIRRPKVVWVITDAPEMDRWTMTCTCEDFKRHTDVTMTSEELQKRKVSAAKLIVGSERQVYGARCWRVETRDKKGERFNEVSLVKGGREEWLCKHGLAVLLGGALTPGVMVPDVVVAEGLEDNGTDCVRVNSAVVIGWRPRGLDNLLRL